MVRAIGAQEVSDVLNLGCGFDPMDRAVNHDRVKHSDFVDVEWDLERLPWPFPADGFSLVVAHDVMEHISHPVQKWLDEIWRILKPGGVVRLRVPAWDNPVSYRDPTHVRVFHEETFDYWDPEKEMHRNYGVYYFGESAKWWTVSNVSRINADPRYGIGDLQFVLQKLTDG
jgi:SAM-dependent methyltransferase